MCWILRESDFLDIVLDPRSLGSIFKGLWSQKLEKNICKQALHLKQIVCGLPNFGPKSGIRPPFFYCKKNTIIFNNVNIIIVCEISWQDAIWFSFCRKIILVQTAWMRCHGTICPLLKAFFLFLLSACITFLSEGKVENDQVY